MQKNVQGLCINFAAYEKIDYKKQTYGIIVQRLNSVYDAVITEELKTRLSRIYIPKYEDLRPSIMLFYAMLLISKRPFISLSIVLIQLISYVVVHSYSRAVQTKSKETQKRAQGIAQINYKYGCAKNNLIVYCCGFVHFTIIIMSAICLSCFIYNNVHIVSQLFYIKQIGFLYAICPIAIITHYILLLRMSKEKPQHKLCSHAFFAINSVLFLVNSVRYIYNGHSILLTCACFLETMTAYYIGYSILKQQKKQTLFNICCCYFAFTVPMLCLGFELRELLRLEYIVSFPV